MPGHSTELRNARLDADNAVVGSGAKLELYTDPRPATGGAVGAATKLSSHNLSSTPFAAASGGVRAANAIADGVGLANGNATWGRIVKSGGGFVTDYSVSDDAGAGEIKLQGTNEVHLGQPVVIDSLVTTAGNA